MTTLDQKYVRKYLLTEIKPKKLYNLKSIYKSYFDDGIKFRLNIESYPKFYDKFISFSKKKLNHAVKKDYLHLTESIPANYRTLRYISICNSFLYSGLFHFETNKSLMDKKSLQELVNPIKKEINE